MPKVTAHMSISLDGFVAGPHQTLEEPLGVRGEELHAWHLGQTDNEVDRAMTERLRAPSGGRGGGGVRAGRGGGGEGGGGEREERRGGGGGGGGPPPGARGCGGV